MSRRERTAAPEQGELGSDVPLWERRMNAEQLEVIRHDGGPIACFAGAGSGKTRALVHRVVRLVAHGTPGDRIFCVTFSRAGANEMDARIRQLGCSGVNVQTWHAFCARVLREDGVPAGSWTVDEKDKAKTLVKQAIGYKHENWVGADLTKVRRFIGVCKANLWDAFSEEASAQAKKDFGHNAGRAVKVYSISQDLIEAAQLLTFDDMLVYVARHFAEDDDARRSWGAKFDYVMTDEAQDNNVAQVTIARMLARESRNLMVVGDPGQAIYGFRGSSPKYLVDFPGEWDARVVTMNRNYRSAPEIVEVANEIIRRGSARLPEDMVAERPEPGSVEVLGSETLEDEAGEVVAALKARASAGRALSDVCVLFRLNAQSRSLEDAMLAEKIPYVIVGGTNFYERREVKDLLAYLRLAAGRDKDGDAVRRCINAPFRFLGAAFVERVMDLSKGAGEVDWTFVVGRAAQAAGIQQRQRQSAAEWIRIVERATQMVREGVPEDAARDDGQEPKMRTASAFEVLSFIVQTTGYIAWLEKEEGEESVESSHAANVREMVRVAQSFTTVQDMLDFVDKQVEESAKQKRKKSAAAVTLMSIHRSKGLEWPEVWVVGCNEQILPHAKGDPEEERRLMYVAATRARDRLVFSYVREMATRQGVRPMDRSRFLLEAFPESEDEEEAANPGSPEEIAVMVESLTSSGTMTLRVGDEEVSTEVTSGDSSAEVAERLVSQLAPANPGSRTLAQAIARIDEKQSALAWLGPNASCATCGAPVAECFCGESHDRVEPGLAQEIADEIGG